MIDNLIFYYIDESDLYTKTTDFMHNKLIRKQNGINNIQFYIHNCKKPSKLDSL